MTNFRISASLGHEAAVVRFLYEIALISIASSGASPVVAPFALSHL